MNKYRKKPVIVNAVHNLPENEIEILDFFNFTKVPFQVVGPWTFEIYTLEGTMTAIPGDWIIQGTRGEVYPCKPGPFEDTFEFME